MTKQEIDDAIRAKQKEIEQLKDMIPSDRRFYLGSRFKVNGEEYLLCAVEDSRWNLINVQTGFRWGAPKMVSHSFSLGVESHHIQSKIGGNPMCVTYEKTSHG